MAIKISQMAAALSLDGAELLEASRLSATVTITASTISALASDNSFNDSGSGFVTAGFAIGDQVKVTGFTGNAANNIFSAKITALTTAKMTIGGTDGDVIVNDSAGESVTITKWETVRTTAQEVADLASGAGGGGLDGLTFTSDTGSTADSDPGNGLMKWNNAAQASATVLYFDNQTLDAVSLATFFGSLPATGYVRLEQEDDDTKWQLWKWTSVTDGTGYRKLGVTLQANGGSIADDKTVLVDFKPDATGTSGTTGKHAVWIAAGSMTPSVSGGCSPLATITSAANQPDIQSLDFDPSTQEYAQFSMRMPKSWNEGTVTFVPVWSHPATVTNFGVVWDLQLVAVSDDDAIATNFGTAQTSTDTGGTTNDVYIGPESSAITVGGSPAAEDLVCGRISRVTGNGSDTMAVDARLHGITLFITTDAENDA